MASPVFKIRDTGRNSARTGDVQELADHVVHSWTSVTTGTIAVTDDTNTDVSFTQPADTIIRNLSLFQQVTLLQQAVVVMM